MKRLLLVSLVILANQVNIAWGEDMPSNYKKISSFVSKCNDEFWLRGGQVLIVNIDNLNILGTIFTISTDLDGERSAIISPKGSRRFKFSMFGVEPMSWHLKTGTSSDVCSVNITIYSTWKEGDSPNR